MRNVNGTEKIHGGRLYDRFLFHAKGGFFLTVAIVTQVAAKLFKLYPSTIKDLWTSNPLKSTKSYFYIIKTVCYVSFIFTLVTNSTHRLLWFQPIKVSLTC